MSKPQSNLPPCPFGKGLDAMIDWIDEVASKKENYDIAFSQLYDLLIRKGRAHISLPLKK